MGHESVRESRQSLLQSSFSDESATIRRVYITRTSESRGEFKSVAGVEQLWRLWNDGTWLPFPPNRREGGFIWVARHSAAQQMQHSSAPTQLWNEAAHQPAQSNNDSDASTFDEELKVLISLMAGVGLDLHKRHQHEQAITSASSAALPKPVRFIRRSKKQSESCNLSCKA